VLRAWTQAKALDSGPRHQPAADFLPLGLRHALPLAAELAGLARIRSEHAGEDGSRLLVELADGQTGRERAAAARRPVHLDPGWLRGGLHLLHDRPRRPAAPGR
jgi:hypothetical protein